MNKGQGEVTGWGLGSECPLTDMKSTQTVQTSGTIRGGSLPRQIETEHKRKNRLTEAHMEKKR